MMLCCHLLLRHIQTVNVDNPSSDLTFRSRLEMENLWGSKHRVTLNNEFVGKDNR